MEVELRAEVENPQFGFMVSDERGRGVLAIASESTQHEPGRYAAGDDGDRATWTSTACWPAAATRSRPRCAAGPAEPRLMDHRENAASFDVSGRRPAAAWSTCPTRSRSPGRRRSRGRARERPAEAPAHRVTGPAALSGDWRRFLNLTMTLALTDWKLRFFGSALGYVWSLLRPLLLFGILYLVFSQIVKIGEAVPNYPLVLLIGVVLFAYFAEVTGRLRGLRRRPRVAGAQGLVPAHGRATVGGAVQLVQPGAEPDRGRRVRGRSRGWSRGPAGCCCPIPILLLVVLATGVGMLLSALYVTLRDVGPIWDVIAQGLFYASPVFFPIEFVIDELQRGRRPGRDGQPPGGDHHRDAAPAARAREPESPVGAIGGSAGMLIPFGLVVFLAVLGFWVFNRNAPRVAEAL